MVRTVIELSEDQKEALNNLSAQLGRSKADIVRTGIYLYRMAVHEARQGNRIGVTRDDRLVKELVGPWCEAEPASAI